MGAQELVYELQDGAVEYSIPFKLSKAFSEGQVPQEFAGLKLEKGCYVYGYGNVAGEVDEQGDEVTSDALRKGIENLDQAPYNKVFISHNYQKIACGKIVYKTVVNVQGKDKALILCKLNESLVEFPETLGSINGGYLDSFSVGGSYGQVQKVYDQERGRYVNKILSFKVREVSLTSYPANGSSSVLGTFTKTREVIKQMEASRMAEHDMKKEAPADLKKDDPAAAPPVEQPAAPPSEDLAAKVAALSEQVAGLSTRLEAAENAVKTMATAEATPDNADPVAKSEVRAETAAAEEVKDGSAPGLEKEKAMNKTLPTTAAELRTMIHEEFKKVLAPAKDEMRKSIDAAAVSEQNKLSKAGNSTTAQSSTPLMDFLKGASPNA